MADVGETAKALLEAVEGVGFREAQYLERDQALLLLIIGFVDNAECTGTDTPLNQESIGPGKVLGALGRVDCAGLRRARGAQAFEVVESD